MMGVVSELNASNSRHGVERSCFGNLSGASGSEEGMSDAPIENDLDAKRCNSVPPCSEDPLHFLTQDHDTGSLGEDRVAERILEVMAVWGDVVMDVQHFPLTTPAITIGAATGHRWRICNAPIAWVPASFSVFARLMTPLVTNVCEEWRSDFYAPASALPTSTHPLFTTHGDALRVHVRPEWPGFIQRRGRRVLLSEIVASDQATPDGDGGFWIAIAETEHVLVQIGEVSFFGRKVYRSRAVEGTRWFQVDTPFLTLVALMAALLVAVSAQFAGEGAQTDIIPSPERFVLGIFDPVQPPVRSPEHKTVTTNASSGRKAVGEEGRVGDADDTRQWARGLKTHAGRRRADREIVDQAGVLGVLNASGALSGMFDSSALDDGVVQSVGGLWEARGDQLGAAGLGNRGEGLGSGGDVDTIGGLGPNGRRIGDGVSGLSGGEKPEGLIQPAQNEVILGALRPDQIRPVIQRHLSQIRYCYQRQLTRDAELAGKVEVKFVISADGSVSKAEVRSSTVENQTLNRCLEGRFLRMRFPAPSGGGIVLVRYPFLFSQK